MKVNLSVQTLNNSTAQWMDQTMDRLFDMMNSRKPFGKGFKGSLTLQNKNMWLPFLDKANEYLANLQTADGVFLTLNAKLHY